MRLLALTLALLAGLSAEARAQDQTLDPATERRPPRVEVVATTSDPVIAVDSSFKGQTVTIFGNIETDLLTGTNDDPGFRPFSVVVLVQGPGIERDVREKGRRLGLVLNVDAASYRRLPGFYALLSSAPPRQILDEALLAQPRMSFAGITAQARTLGDGAVFDPELIRLMRAEGLWVEGERAVSFLSPTAFSVRVPLTSHVPNGAFLARVLAIRDGQILAEGVTRFTVRTTGFERFVADTANRHPYLYALATVLIAIGTGWLGGVLFRR